MERKQVDWNVIRAEYIKNENTSYRKLAKKYNVSATTLTERAIREKWVALRNQKRSKTIAKIVDKASDESSELQISINDVANALLAKINETIEVSALINSQTLKQLTSALKDLKDIKGEKAEENDNDTTGVVFLPSVVGQEVTDNEQ